jgi:hypothetical protein
VTLVGGTKTHKTFYLHTWRNHLEYTDADRKIMLKWILGKWGGLNSSAQVVYGPEEGFCEQGNEHRCWSSGL